MLGGYVTVGGSDMLRLSAGWVWADLKYLAPISQRRPQAAASNFPKHKTSIVRDSSCIAMKDGSHEQRNNVKYSCKPQFGLRNMQKGSEVVHYIGILCVMWARGPEGEGSFGSTEVSQFKGFKGCMHACMTAPKNKSVWFPRLSAQRPT